MRRDGDTAGAEALQARSRALGEHERVLADELDVVQRDLRELLLRIPNLPHPDAPDGADERDNPVVKGPVRLPDEFAEHQRVPHWETAAALGILDNERATKISGAMFTMQRGLGATLSRALCQYALDRNADAFEEIRPPSLVTHGDAHRHRPAAQVRRRRVRDRARRPVVHPDRGGAADVALRRRGARRRRSCRCG